MNINKLYYKNNYLNIHKYILFYQEYNKMYMYSNSSSRKFKELNYLYSINNNNEFNKYISLFLYKKNKYKNRIIENKNKIIEKDKLNFFKQCFYENKSKLKIIGRGWKIIKYSNELILKLGYSHSIFFFLNPIYKHKLKKKKKKYYTFYGVSYNSINNFLNKIKLMRIPDTYTRKGIFHNTVKF